jgi:hypothetical protein
MALPFTLKSILMQNKNDGNLCTKFVVNLFAKTKGKSQVLSQNPSIRKSKDSSPSPNSPLTKTGCACTLWSEASEKTREMFNLESGLIRDLFFNCQIEEESLAC